MSDKLPVNFPLTITMSELLAYNETMSELASLRAQLAAVPVEALRRQYKNGFPFEGDIETITAWLRSLELQP